MDAEYLNPVISPQASDKLFVGRYVSGLFTPLYMSMGQLISLLPVIQPTLSTEAVSIALNTTYQASANFTAVTGQGVSSVLALPVPAGPCKCTVANKTTDDLSVIVIDLTMIEGAKSATIPPNTSVTFFFVVGDNTWYAK